MCGVVVMKRHRQRKQKCKNCREYFYPDHRVVKRQKFCSKATCRIASKRESQRRWLSQPNNRDYFRGSTNVQRVQRWRKAHPRYWRRSRAKGENALQDQTPTQPTDFKGETKHMKENVLQDSILLQHADLIRLFSRLDPISVTRSDSGSHPSIPYYRQAHGYYWFLNQWRK